jgi:ABC-type amino acid transport substrate-binding protein
MAKSISKVVVLMLFASVFIGCATTLDSQGRKSSNANILRVGVTPNYPPMIFKLKGEIKGVEADLAFRLGKALDRQVQFIELGWDKQIQALIEKKIDIIMSGMTITEAREARINFTAPYLRSGLAALMRAEDASKFDDVESPQESFSTVGVIQGTTGEVFVRDHFLKAANIISFQKASEAPYLLKNRRIDLFIHDAPSIAWLVSENEGAVKGLWKPLNSEYLGWGVRREDQELLIKVNSVLNTWKKDGTLKGVLTEWLPYWKDFD